MVSTEEEIVLLCFCNVIWKTEVEEEEEEEVGGGRALHLLSDHRRGFAECMTSASSPHPSLSPDVD